MCESQTASQLKDTTKANLGHGMCLLAEVIVEDAGLILTKW